MTTRSLTAAQAAQGTYYEARLLCPSLFLFFVDSVNNGIAAHASNMPMLPICAPVNTIMDLFTEILNNADDEDRNDLKALLLTFVKIGRFGAGEEFYLRSTYGIDVNYAEIVRLFAELDYAQVELLKQRLQDPVGGVVRRESDERTVSSLGENTTGTGVSHSTWPSIAPIIPRTTLPLQSHPTQRTKRSTRLRLQCEYIIVISSMT